MQTDMLLVASGVLVGFLAVSLGGGGGGLYVALLTEAFRVPPAVAVSTSLATIVPTVVTGAYGHWSQGHVRLDLGWPALVGGSAGSLAGALMAPLIPAALYVRGLGALTLAMTALVLVRRPGPRDTRAMRRATLGALFGAVGGFLSGIAGISGSLPISLGLLLLGCDATAAVGTTVLVLVGVSATGLLAHLHGGTVDWRLVGWLSAGTVAGGVLAPLVVARLGRRRMERLFRPVVVALSLVAGLSMLVAPFAR